MPGPLAMVDEEDVLSDEVSVPELLLVLVVSLWLVVVEEDPIDELSEVGALPVAVLEL